MTTREIKFRAWDEEVGMMFPLDESINLEELRKGVISHDGENWIKCIYMEFTGLYDKNGVEVFESDIIKDYQGYLFEVVWDNNNALFGWKRLTGVRNGEMTWHILLFGGEVIGNIYQNSSLLIK